MPRLNVVSWLISVIDSNSTIQCVMNSIALAEWENKTKMTVLGAFPK